MKSGIYVITNTINSKKYIGKDSNLPIRWSQHKSKLNKGTHHNPHLQSSWNKYGEAIFVYEILEYCTPKILIEREQYYMDFHDTLNNPAKGYNVRKADGSEMSEETKAKLSATLLGRKLPPEHCANISAAVKGKPKTLEHNANVSAALKGNQNSLGNKHSEETKAKISIANKGRKLSVESLSKMSASLKGRQPWNKGKTTPMKGKPWSDARREAQNSRLSGFTILELLIVMLIIMILASILFPILATVKGKAQQTKCISNLRQLGMAISMYANDHDDLPPMGGYETTVQPTFPLPVLQIASTAATYRVDWEDTLIGMAYVRSYAILACPAAPTNDYRYSYGVNRWVMGWGTSVKLDSIPYPSNTAIITEKTGYDWPIWLPGEQTLGGQNNPYYFPVDPRHSNQLNVLLADGHIRRVAVGEMIQGGDILWKFQ